LRIVMIFHNGALAIRFVLGSGRGRQRRASMIDLPLGTFTSTMRFQKHRKIGLLVALPGLASVGVSEVPVIPIVRYGCSQNVSLRPAPFVAYTIARSNVRVANPTSARVPLPEVRSR
jgi:hypothetical protein